MVNIAVLVSGGGTNLQALIDAERRGEIPNGKITAVISSNPDAYALERAQRAGIAGITGGIWGGIFWSRSCCGRGRLREC